MALKFRQLLLDRLQELDTLSDAATDKRKPVELDQQSVGRLSRQDALQQQAMANAQEQRRLSEGVRLKAALKRIDDGEYGWCEECGEAIAPRRLEIDPAARLCADCAAERG